MRVVVLVSVAFSICAIACESPDYATHFDRASTTSDPNAPTPVADQGITANEPDASGTAAPPASAPSDAGPPPAPPPSTPNAFAGAPAYVATSGGSTNVGAHGTNGNPAGKRCFSCHGGGGAGPSMTFGGTAYADAAGTTPLARAEVRLVIGGTAITTYTNATGNFFVLGARLSGSGVIGARDATTTHTMNAAVTSGDCNSCHDGTTTARINLP